MLRIMNHLIQLQELALIRAEQQSQRGGANLEALDASIQTLLDQLPEDARHTARKLRTRDSIFVVPVAQGGCSGCGMKLPISLVQDVHRAASIVHCPVCTRILYYPDAPPRHIAKAPRRFEQRRVGIMRFSSPSLMIPKLKAADRDGVIRELAECMQTQGYVDDAEKLWQAALKRESIVSTVVEPGMAFPHVRGVEGGGLTLALGLSAKGIHFGESEKGLTKMVFFIVIPIAASAFYLKLLAGLAETFIDAENRKALLSVENADKMWKALVKATKKTIS